MFRQKKAFTIAFLIIITLSLVLPFASINAQAAPLNPIAHWKFDEGSGVTAIDSSGNGNTGTLMGTPTWVLGKVADALHFNGLTDYIEVPDSSSLDLQDFSIAAWIYLDRDVINTQARIVSKQEYYPEDAYMLGLFGSEYCGSTGNQLVLSVGNGVTSISLMSNSSLLAGTWYFVVGTHKGLTSKLFIDGQLDKVGTTVAQTTGIDVPLTIGCMKAPNAEFFFPGIIDDIQIYNRDLTTDEIETIFREHNNLSAPSPTTTPTDMLTETEKPAQPNKNYSNFMLFAILGIIIPISTVVSVYIYLFFKKKKESDSNYLRISYVLMSIFLPIAIFLVLSAKFFATPIMGNETITPSVYAIGISLVFVVVGLLLRVAMVCYGIFTFLVASVVFISNISDFGLAAIYSLGSYVGLNLFAYFIGNGETMTRKSGYYTHEETKTYNILEGAWLAFSEIGYVLLTIASSIFVYVNYSSDFQTALIYGVVTFVAMAIGGAIVFYLIAGFTTYYK